MKTIRDVMYCIRARDHLNAETEDMICIYGDEGQFIFMAGLCQWLTRMMPDKFVEFIHYSYGSEGTVGEVYYQGEEINVDDNGTYYMIDSQDRVYTLKDTPEGLVWEPADKRE